MVIVESLRRTEFEECAKESTSVIPATAAYRMGILLHERVLQSIGLNLRQESIVKFEFLLFGSSTPKASN
jgi:hypothetical protein